MTQSPRAKNHAPQEHGLTGRAPRRVEVSTGGRIATRPSSERTQPTYGGPLKHNSDAGSCRPAICAPAPAEHGRSGRLARRAAERWSDLHRSGICGFGGYGRFARNSYSKNTRRLGGFGGAGTRLVTASQHATGTAPKNQSGKTIPRKLIG
jgi:hypothetical protein